MNDVIDRIAISAEKNPRNNVLFGYCGKYGDNLMTPEEERTGLSSERIHELNQELYAKGQLHLPRLSVDEIKIEIACNSLTEMINNMCRDDFEMGMIWNNVAQ